MKNFTLQRECIIENAKVASFGMGPRGGGYSIYPWVGRCVAAPHTLTLFKTNIADFPTLFTTDIPIFDTLFNLTEVNIN